MSFNPNNFIKKAGSSVLNRAVSAGSSAIDKRVGGKGYVDLVSGILTSGASVQTIKSIASLQFDRLLSSASDDFFSRIGIKSNKGRLGSADQLTDRIYGTPDQTILRYPNDLGSYAVALRFMQYNRPSPDSPVSDPDTSKVIYLPLPRELIQNQSSQLGTPELGIVGGIADAVIAGRQENIEGAAPALAAKSAQAVALKAATGGAARLLAVGVLGAEGLNVISQYTGSTINPNIGVVYNGPNLREYNFNWELSPNNQSESKALQDIIEQIQQRSLASRAVTGSAMILAYPEMVQIKVLPRQLEDIMPYKRSLIKSVTVNYASNGIPTFFEGTKLPTFINLSISFQEIEYFLADDFGGPKARGFKSETISDLVNDSISLGGDVFDKAASIAADVGLKLPSESIIPSDNPADGGM